MYRKSWSPQDIEILKMIYPNSYSHEVAQILGRTKRAIYSAAKVHNLKKSNEFIKMELARQGERLKVAGKPFRRQKGFVPINKGVKMTEEQYQKAKHTFFKKGNVPHNAKPEVNEVLRACGYWYTRISENKWYPKHQLLWEKTHGKPPEGMVLIFKDGNKNNCVIENLKLITFAENMMRNTIVQYPPELQTVIKLNNKIKRKINEKHIG